MNCHRKMSWNSFLNDFAAVSANKQNNTDVKYRVLKEFEKCKFEIKAKCGLHALENTTSATITRTSIIYVTTWRCISRCLSTKWQKKNRSIAEKIVSSLQHILSITLASYEGRTRTYQRYSAHIVHKWNRRALLISYTRPTYAIYATRTICVGLRRQHKKQLLKIKSTQSFRLDFLNKLQMQFTDFATISVMTMNMMMLEK